MRTLKKQIKTKLIMIALLVCATIYSQTEIKNKSLFVRVYNLEGKKINKGKMVNLTDSILTIEKNSISKKIAITEIGFIKTKRSEGNNIVMGTVAGAAFGAILGAATADPDAWILGYTSAEGAIGGGVLGAVGGAAIGGITILFKKSETYVINGNREIWNVFKEMIEKK